VAKSTGLSARQLGLLGKLKGAHALKGFYLAGGSAIGWHFGHRVSADLDFFSVERGVEFSEVIEELTAMGATVRTESRTMVGFDTAAGPVDLVRYPYRPLRAPKKGPAGFPIAAPIDLAVMKVAAISRRGLRRDFWDLHVLLTDGGLTLAAVLSAYGKRYGTSAADRYHLVRSLAFFDDAERDDPRLTGLSRRRWEQIKVFFSEQATRLLK
jgi:hypothetical protein